MSCVSAMKTNTIGLSGDFTAEHVKRAPLSDATGSLLQKSKLLQIARRLCHPSSMEMSNTMSHTCSGKPTEKRTFRNLCGLRPANTKSAKSRTTSNEAPSGAAELSLLQTFALCTLDLGAPASDMLLSAGRRMPANSLSAGSDCLSRSDSSESSTASDRLSQDFAAECETAVDTPHAQFIQLSGHRDCFRPAQRGRVWKRLVEQPSAELTAYEILREERPMRAHVACFYGERVDAEGAHFLELADLLSQFHAPAWLMDVKMGSRTFLEREVKNAEAREDLFVKLEKTLRTGGVDARQLLTEQELQQRAITKLRYMSLREQLSSSSTLGFRVEAYKCNGNPISNDLQYVREQDQVKQILREFLPQEADLRSQMATKLRDLRNDLLQSSFFASHELIGSSLLIVHDRNQLGVWMIDFAKTLPLPKNVQTNHRAPWSPGNHEDGYLQGLDNLIEIVQSL